METNQMENQHLFAIKQELKKYSKLIVSVIAVVAVGICFGQYWKYHTAIKISQASDIYQEMLVASYKPDLNTANAKGELLITDYAGTPYYQAAALLLAKNAVDDSKLDKAEEYLRLIVAHKGSKNLMFDIATVRLAQVLRERGDVDGALALLEVGADRRVRPFEVLYQDALGDIYVSKGETAKAKVAYKNALEALPEGAQAPLIQMKFVDLGIGENDAS